MATIAEQLADFATGPAIRRPPAAAIRRVTTHALDTLAVALAGSRTRSSAAVVRALDLVAGAGPCTVFGLGRAGSPQDAALANGTFAHALELDDDHRIAVLHPGAVVVPAAFAVAESEAAPGLAFLRGILAGYEVACRVGEAFLGRQLYHGLHPTPLCGVFGAAAAAATVCGLDREAFVRALAIAGTQAFGLTEWRADGSWIKRLHPGRAAQTGVLSAMLARAGFTGPATIFEGPGGFFNAFSGGEPVDAEAVTRELGVAYRGLGTAIKPYPCCRFAHGAIDLALEAHAGGMTGDRIAKIEVRIFRSGVLSYHAWPLNAVDAQFNLPYVVALGLTRGRLRLGDFVDGGVDDARVRALAARVKVVEEPSFTAAYPERYTTELELETRSGERRRFVNHVPSGDPGADRYREHPERLREEVRDKVRSLLAECAFADRVDPLIAAVEGLGEAEGVGGVARRLGGGSPAPENQWAPPGTD